MSNGFSCRIIFTNELRLRNRAHKSLQMFASDTHWGMLVTTQEETFQAVQDGKKCLLQEKQCG